MECRNLKWIQIITLGLCVVLLFVIIAQGWAMKEYRQQMKSDMESLRRSVENDLQSISDRIAWELEEADRVIVDYALKPTGLDKERRCLQADVSVTMKEWHEDTEIELLAVVGEEDVSLAMTADGNGVFSGQLLLPLEDDHEIILSALISGGGLSRKETIGGWGNISMLLPLQNGGGGWSGPNYHEGVMSSQFHITIRGYDEVLGLIQEPEFQVYKNGKLAQTLEAVIDSYSSSSDGICYTVNTQDNHWRIKCEEEDVIEIHFLCQDEFGLGYDFLFQTWVVEGETADYQVNAGNSYGSDGLKLEWLGK